MKKRPNHTPVSSLFMIVLCCAALALIAPLPGGGWWFGAQVQNVSSTTASISFTVYDFASGTYSLSDSIVPGGSKTYTTFSFPGMPDNFQGSSKVNSGQDIRAIVNLTNRSAGGLGDGNSPSPAEGQYQGMNTAGTTLHFPLVKNHHYGNTTTIIVQNVGTGPAAASAAFHFPNNYNYTYTTPTLNPGQMAVIEPIDAHSGQAHPPTNDNTNSVGSLTVTSSQLLAGVSLEHRTMEDHATVLKATRGFTNSDGDTTLYAPINKNNYYNRFTGLQVQNISGGSIDVHVTYTAIHDN